MLWKVKKKKKKERKQQQKWGKKSQWGSVKPDSLEFDKQAG